VAKKKESVKEKLVRLQKEFAELAKNRILLGLSSDYIQLDDEYFVKTFAEYEIEERGCKDYNWKYSANLDGIKALTIVTDDEHKAYQAAREVTHEII